MTVKITMDAFKIFSPSCWFLKEVEMSEYQMKMVDSVILPDVNHQNNSCQCKELHVTPK